MTKLAELLNWPDGGKVTDLTVRIRRAWPYEEKEVNTKDGKSFTLALMPFDVVDDTLQAGHEGYKYGFRIEWKKPSRMDHEALEGALITINTVDHATAELHVVPAGYKTSGQRSIRAYGDSLTFNDPPPITGPSQQAFGQQPASQAAPAPSGALPHKDWWDLYGAELDEARIYHPDDDLNARPAAISAMIAVSRGEKVRPRLSSEATAPEAPPAEDDPPPPDDDSLPF